jgi:hypothetical protein
LPDNLQADEIRIEACPNLETIGQGLKGRLLHILNCPKLTRLGDGVAAERRLTLADCPNLADLGVMGNVQRLTLQNCAAVTSVHLPRPSQYSVSGEIHIEGCAAFTHLDPATATETLVIKNCPHWNTVLPDGIQRVAHDPLGTVDMSITGNAWRTRHRKANPNPKATDGNGTQP